MEKQPENHKPRKPAMSQKNRHRNFPPPLFPAVLRTDDAYTLARERGLVDESW